MKAQSGFSLLEVLIAIAIMLFGIAGYVRLQSHYIKLDHTLNLRQQALSLAARKLDDLQSFSLLQPSEGEISYQNISSDTGGRIAAGEVLLKLWQSQSQTTPFDLHWRVKNMYFVDTDNDDIADSWLPDDDVNLPATLPVIAPKKALQIIVSWQDQFGESLNVTLNSELTPVPFVRSAQVQNTGLGSILPLRVMHQPPTDNLSPLHTLNLTQAVQGIAPAIEVLGDNNMVEIEQTTLELVVPEYQEKYKEAQLVVSCDCRLAENGLGKTPSVTRIEGEALVTQLGQDIVKERGIVADDQHTRCEQCCNDHHDTSGMVDTQNYYRLEDGLKHRHYARLGENSFQEALLIGDEYQEVCRFKRIDGFYHIVPDWELLAITEFDARHLNLENNRNAYTDFIRQRLKAYIQNSTVTVGLDGRNLNLSLGRFQLAAYALYVERLYSEDKAYLNELIADGDERWLALTPFYDINVTLLANWHSSDNQIVNILQQAIQTVENVEQDYYASYQRGLIETLISGRTRVYASMNGSNSGLVGQFPLSPFEALYVVEGSGIEIDVQP
ncbi:prepilin-type N-terminal cleavage/methylation domain-containing protein [Paraglaciecola sp. L1A13]|uniref:type IV pilus modification PilV family protein n=1 Tax=Paraglaciecola sp. L1A13 TaxID=2686359 RepID=UPI00131B81B3|nr:prepilin-type N-terminal cleavage/methylation domain-containing protein [Paraglaciecola sp. L1A13]